MSKLQCELYRLTIAVHRDHSVVTPTLRPGDERRLAAPQGLKELQSPVVKSVA